MPAPVARPTAWKISPGPVPSGAPVVPPDVLALVGRPVARAEFTGAERTTVRRGLPLLGAHGTAVRGVTFSNDLSLLRLHGKPWAQYAGATLPEAAVSAQRAVWELADRPAGAGGQSIAAAVVQAADGAYYAALVGSGNPTPAFSDLNYQVTRYTGDLQGKPPRASTAARLTPWSDLRTKDGQLLTGVAQPEPDEPVQLRNVRDPRLLRVVGLDPAIKALVDVRGATPVEPDGPVTSAGPYPSGD